jgi:hypothetical protein
MWAKKWLLGRDRFTHLNLLDFIRNEGPEDYKNYLRMSDENVQYLIAKVKPLIARQDTVMRNAVTPEAASRALPKALTSQDRIGQVRFVTLHTRTSLTHWNPSPAGHVCVCVCVCLCIIKHRNWLVSIPGLYSSLNLDLLPYTFFPNHRSLSSCILRRYVIKYTWNLANK